MIIVNGPKPAESVVTFLLLLLKGDGPDICKITTNLFFRQKVRMLLHFCGYILVLFWGIKVNFVLVNVMVSHLCSGFEGFCHIFGYCDGITSWLTLRRLQLLVHRQKLFFFQLIMNFPHNNTQS